MTAQGEDILAWLESAVGERETVAQDALAFGDGFVGSDTCVYGTGYGGPYLQVVVPGFEGQAEAATKHFALYGPESVLRRCAADRKAMALYTETVAIRDRSAASLQAAQNRGNMPDPCVLDDWSRANRETTFMLPLIELLAEGYGWTGGER